MHFLNQFFSNKMLVQNLADHLLPLSTSPEKKDHITHDTQKNITSFTTVTLHRIYSRRV